MIEPQVLLKITTQGQLEMNESQSTQAVRQEKTSHGALKVKE